MLELLPKFGRKNSWTYLKKFVHFSFTPNWMAPFLWICKTWRHSWHIPACISRFSRTYTKSFSIVLPVAGVNLVSASHFHFNLERLFMFCCFPYGVQCWLASKSLMCPAILHDVPYMMCPVTSLCEDSEWLHCLRSCVPLNLAFLIWQWTCAWTYEGALACVLDKLGIIDRESCCRKLVSFHIVLFFIFSALAYFLLDIRSLSDDKFLGSFIVHGRFLSVHLLRSISNKAMC